MPLHPILRLIYRFLKVLVLSAFNTFFAKTKIINKHLLRFRNPAIVVSNHPNTLQDPLNVAASVKKVVFFLANASLFQTPVANKLLSTLYCIPVERAKDVKGRPIRNEKNFEKCDNFLTSGGCLYIAPEGGSDPARRLNPVRTGTARIALSAESKNDFQLGLTILPVGLNYSAPTDFRSDLLMHVGEPIKLSEYKEQYEKDTFRAAKNLTAELAAKMELLILNTKDGTEDQLLAHLQTLLHSDEPLSLEAEYFRTKNLLAALQQLRETDIRGWEKLQQNASKYFVRLAELRISDIAVRQYMQQRRGALAIRNGALLLLLLPVYLYAVINHFLANYLPAMLARKLNLYVGYMATVKILAGLLTYPLFYGLQVYMVHVYFQQWPATILYIISLLLTWGLLFWYQSKAKRFIESRRTQKIAEDKLAVVLELRSFLAQFTRKLLSNLPVHNASD